MEAAADHQQHLFVLMLNGIFSRWTSVWESGFKRNFCVNTNTQKKLGFLFSLLQGFPQTPPPTLSTNSSLHHNILLHSSQAPRLHQWTMFQESAQFLELLQPLSPPMMPRGLVVGPYQQLVYGPHTHCGASPTHWCLHLWEPLTQRCTHPWCLSPVSTHVWSGVKQLSSHVALIQIQKTVIIWKMWTKSFRGWSD